MINRIIFALFMFLFTACSAGDHVYFKSGIGTDVTSSSVVTIIRPEIIDDDDGVPAGIGYVDSCNAFYIRNADNAGYLITAAHCVKGYSVGEEFIFIAPNGFGGKKAKIVNIDPVKDFAVATTDVPLIGLNINFEYIPSPGDTSLIVSSLYKKISVGYVIEEPSYGWIITDNTIVRGWSGSPVMNGNGEVWGIVSTCQLSESSSNCKPGYARIRKLY